MGRLDKSFAEVDNTLVTSRRGFYRYRKKGKKGDIATYGRKFGRFHKSDQGYLKGE